MMVTSGSMLASDCAEDARTEGDAAAGVYVPSLPSSAGMMESSSITTNDETIGKGASQPGLRKKRAGYIVTTPGRPMRMAPGKMGSAYGTVQEIRRYICISMLLSLSLIRATADSNRKGVLLLEIAYWKLTTQFDEMKAQPLILRGI